LSNKIINYILHTLVVLALIELVFNAPTLFTSHEKIIWWELPEIACENDEGVCCIVDKNWTQMTVLNSDKTIRSVVSTKFSSDIAPDNFCDIAIDNNYVYILDRVRSKNGTSILSERILKYNLDGRYVSTVYTDSEAGHDFQGNILSIKIYDGKLFVLKAHGDSATVIQIQEGTEKEIMRCSFPNLDIQTASYQPEINTMTVSTMNGKSFLFNGKVRENVKLSDSSAIIANIVVMPDGSRYILDRNNGLLIKQETDLSETVVCRTKAVWLGNNAPSGKIRHVYLCDDAGNTVSSVSVSDHKLLFITSADQPVKQHIKWHLTICSFVVVAFVMVYYLFRFIIRSIRNRILARKEEKQQLEENGVLSPAALYGKPALFILISFLITGLLLAVPYYQITMEQAVENTNNIASSISSISGETIGDAVKRLDSADDYGNSDYQTAYNFCQTICAGKNNGGFDLLFNLFRMDSVSGNFYYVIDNSTMNVLGTVISPDRLCDLGLDSIANSVRNGKTQSYKFQTSTGRGIYAVAAPIYDSSHEIVGSIMVINDLDAVGDYSRENILTILLRAFSLLSFIIMLYVELKLIREFLKIRKERFAAAGKRVTICEGHRELRIFTRLPFYLLVPFIAPYAKQLAVQSGLSGDPGMLAALPLSIYGLLMAAGGLFMSIITKKNPGRSINIASLVVLAVAAILLLNHLYFKSYYLLLIAFSLLGLMAAVTISACKAIRLYDLKPDDRYKKLVFTNMEPPIYASIGAALGSLIYDSMGFTAVIVVLASVCLVTIVLSKIFIGTDINIGRIEKKTSVKDSRNLRYLLRTDVIGFILFASIPVSFLMQYTSYMLPMFNERIGNTVLVVGFLTLITKLLPIPISPNIIMLMKEKKTSTSAIISLSALTLAFFAFALQPTMISFAVMLFVLGIFYSVIQTLIERFQIESAKSSGIIPSDVNGVFAMATCVGDFAGPLCLAAMMAIGDSATGIISGAFCLLCIAGLLLTSKKRFSNQKVKESL